MPGPDLSRLIPALGALKTHEEQIRGFYCSSVRHQVRRGLSLEDTLKDIFAASVNERRAASFEKGKAAVTAFAREIPDIVKQVRNGRDAATSHQSTFERICLLPNVDQKIAAMFLKFVVNVFGTWPDFKSHLYVPLDRVVLKILKEKLAVSQGLPDQSPTVKGYKRRLYRQDGEPVANYRTFLDVQRWLAEAAQHAGCHRILADELWLVGQLFCKPYRLCHVCWIRDSCLRPAQQGTAFAG